MKRLVYILNHLNQSRPSYDAIYNGKMNLFPFSGDRTPRMIEEPTYWSGGVSYTFLPTNRFEKTKPTVIIAVPAEQLAIARFDAASADFCLRVFVPYIDELNSEIFNRSRSDKENGRYEIFHPDSRILVRNSSFWRMESPCYYTLIGSCNAVENKEAFSPKMYLHFMMCVQLPQAHLKKAIRMLTRMLPSAVLRFIANFDRERFEENMAVMDKQLAIRAWLRGSEYCAFLAEGSILPRAEDGISPLPGAVPFQAPEGEEIEVAGVRGMGIRRGVTVITGGGYSGKSTLLDAISAGIYHHVLGDGREFVLTDEQAVVIAAEDGRSVKRVRISPFIGWLPHGSTDDFSTSHASGSTSQAANIMEAIEAGGRLLLIDDDRSATNFMIRDDKMKRLIEKEPITPFTDRVRELWESCGVSTILVIGGSGEYLSVCDRVYLMEDYRIANVTQRAHALCDDEISEKKAAPACWHFERQISSEGFSSYPSDFGRERLAVYDAGFIYLGDERLDLRAIVSLESYEQWTAVALMLRYLEIHNADEQINLAGKCSALYEKIEREGLDTVYSGIFTEVSRFLELPRMQDVFACVWRMRKLTFFRLDKENPGTENKESISRNITNLLQKRDDS